MFVLGGCLVSVNRDGWAISVPRVILKSSNPQPSSLLRPFLTKVGYKIQEPEPGGHKPGCRHQSPSTVNSSYKAICECSPTFLIGSVSVWDEQEIHRSVNHCFCRGLRMSCASSASTHCIKPLYPKAEKIHHSPKQHL